MAANALSSVLKPITTNGSTDWQTSLERQLEFYQFLQSAEGAIAGGATNSYKGCYEPYPSGVPTFYGMMFEYDPVYHDPGSGGWFGWQAWSMEKVAEYYYETGDVTAKAIMDKWVSWIKDVVILITDGSFEIPATLSWTGYPDTWTGTPTGNPDLHVTVEDYGQDLGVAACLAKALFYYSAAGNRWDTQDIAAKDLGKEIIDRMWTIYRDDKGLAAPEARGDYTRMFDQEVYVPTDFNGTMPNGDPITKGVTFLDIRSKYKAVVTGTVSIYGTASWDYS